MFKEKQIGFSLRGVVHAEEFDSPQNYEIELFPKTPCQGIVFKESFDRVKQVPVSLPHQVKEQEWAKIYALFFQSSLIPVVSFQGHEKLGNRELAIKLESNSCDAVNITILIIGQNEGINYKISIDPNQINQSSVEVRSEEESNFRKARLRFDELKNFPAEILRKVFPKLKPFHFHVHIEGDDVRVVLTDLFRQQIAKLCLTHTRMISQKEKRQIQLDSEQEVDTLYQPEESSNQLDSSKFQKIGYAPSMDSIQMWNRLVHSLDENSMIDPKVLDILKKNLDRIQLQVLSKGIKEGNEAFLNELQSLEFGHYQNILDLLTRSFYCTFEEEDSFLLAQQFHSIVGIMSLMIARGVTKQEKESVIQAYHAISAIPDLQNPYVEYLAHYGKQKFTWVMDHEQRDWSLSDFSHDIFNVFAAIKDPRLLREPWKMVSRLFEDQEFLLNLDPSLEQRWLSWKGGNDLEEAGTVSKRWFLYLIAVWRIILDSSSEALVDFVEAVENKFEYVQKMMDLQHPHFVFGLAEFIWKLVNSAQFGELDERVQHKCIVLLKMISFNNDKEDENLPFNVGDDATRKELKDTLDLILGRSYGNRIRTRFLVHNRSISAP